MGFNLDSFDLTRYNVGGQSVLYLSAYGSEKVTTAIGFSSDIFLSCSGAEQVNRSIVGYPCRFIYDVSGNETVGELVVKGETFIILTPRFTENVTGKFTQAANVKASGRGLESITENSAIAADIVFTVDGIEEILTNVNSGTDLSLSAAGFELVSESASVIILDQKTCKLTVTLKPGQKLLIDAENYTVLLDGENAIELQSGDWIDELDRETTDISILAATGTAYLSASITYQERYL